MSREAASEANGAGAECFTVDGITWVRQDQNELVQLRAQVAVLAHNLIQSEAELKAEIERRIEAVNALVESEKRNAELAIAGWGKEACRTLGSAAVAFPELLHQVKLRWSE